MEPTAQSPEQWSAKAAAAALPAYSLFALYLVAQFALASFLQAASTAFGFMISVTFFIGAPALLLPRAAGFRLAPFLSLRPASPALLGLAFLLAAANYPVASGLQLATKALLPESMRRFLDASYLFLGVGGFDLAMLTVAFCVFAPLFEEVAFRGYLQTVLRARHRDVVAVVVTAVLFSAVHMDPVGSVARVELGALFGLLVVWTRSLWPAVVAHATNNLIPSLLTAYVVMTGGPKAHQGQPAPLKVALLGLAGLAGVALVLWAVRKLTWALPAPAPEEPAQDHTLRAARLGAWLPAWLLGALACAAALFALRWTAFQVSMTDALAPVQGVERRLPSDEARARFKEQVVQAKRRAESGAVDLESYRAMRKRLSELGKADAGGLTLEEVEKDLRLEPADAHPPPTPRAAPAEQDASPH